MNSIETILREYVRHLIEIRTKKDIEPHEKKSYGSKFNFEIFSKIASKAEMIDYADAFLEMLGQGSSRITYLLSSRYVLKIAKNPAGLAQNRVEIATSTDPNVKHIIAAVHRSASDGMWIVSDLVREIKYREFATLAGCTLGEFVEYMDDVERGGVDAIEAPNSLSEPPSKFLVSVGKLMMFNGVSKGDLAEPHHWGVTPDRRLVVLDYGLTDQVWNRHYAGKDPNADKWSYSDVARAKTSNIGTRATSKAR